MGIPLTISYFVEPVPLDQKGWRRYRVVQKKSFALVKNDVAAAYEIVSYHWTIRGARNKASGMNQHYGRG